MPSLSLDCFEFCVANHDPIRGDDGRDCPLESEAVQQLFLLCRISTTSPPPLHASVANEATTIVAHHVRVLVGSHARSGIPWLHYT
jgi:hypothetical protein